MAKKETAEVVAPSDLEGGYHLEIELNGVVRTLVVVCFVFLFRWISLKNASGFSFVSLFCCLKNLVLLLS